MPTDVGTSGTLFIIAKTAEIFKSEGGYTYNMKFTGLGRQIRQPSAENRIIVPRSTPINSVRTRFSGSGSVEFILTKNAELALKNARPMISNYPVGSAALTKDKGGRLWIVRGANIEFRNDHAIHPEESICVSLAVDETVQRIVTLNGKKEIISPCGNSREALLTYSATDARFLKAKGEWMLIKDLLPSRPIKKVRELSPEDQLLIDQAREIISDSYVPYTKTKKAAVILTRSGMPFLGTAQDDVTFHHHHAIEVALDALHARGFDKIKAVVRLSAGKEVDPPCGRCLQKLFEESQKGRTEFKVIASNGESAMVGAISQLLPLAFGPKDLGVDLGKFYHDNS